MNASYTLKFHIVDISEDVEMSYFSGKNGVFMNVTLFRINVLEFFTKIMRQSTPDYPTHLVSILSHTSLCLPPMKFTILS
jgi:hypothetical protein